MEKSERQRAEAGAQHSAFHARLCSEIKKSAKNTLVNKYHRDPDRERTQYLARRVAVAEESLLGLVWSLNSLWENKEINDEEFSRSGAKAIDEWNELLPSRALGFKAAVGRVASSLEAPAHEGLNLALDIYLGSTVNGVASIATNGIWAAAKRYVSEKWDRIRDPSMRELGMPSGIPQRFGMRCWKQLLLASIRSDSVVTLSRLIEIGSPEIANKKMYDLAADHIPGSFDASGEIIRYGKIFTPAEAAYIFSDPKENSSNCSKRLWDIAAPGMSEEMMTRYAVFAVLRDDCNVLKMMAATTGIKAYNRKDVMSAAIRYARPACLSYLLEQSKNEIPVSPDRSSKLISEASMNFRHESGAGMRAPTVEGHSQSNISECDALLTVYYNQAETANAKVVAKESPDVSREAIYEPVLPVAKIS